jgi:putative transposase
MVIGYVLRSLRSVRACTQSANAVGVSRICAVPDEEVGAFRDRSLAETGYRYVFVDAAYRKARVNRRVVSRPCRSTGDRHRGDRRRLP